MNRAFPVNIFGVKFTINTDENEEYVSKLTEYVNKKIGEIKNKANLVPTHSVAIMAALNIADEFFKMKKVYQEEKAQAAKTCEELIQLTERYSSAKEE